jgi:transcription termination factor Rho
MAGSNGNCAGDRGHRLGDRAALQRSAALALARPLRACAPALARALNGRSRLTPPVDATGRAGYSPHHPDRATRCGLIPRVPPARHLPQMSSALMPVNGPDQRSRNRRPRRRPAGRTPMGEFDEFQETDTRELDITELSEMNVNELQTIGRDLEMEAGTTGKEELVDRILVRQSELAGHAYATGILDVVDEGFGFMRRHGLMPSQEDVYVSSSQIRRFGLRVGDRISGSVRAPREGEKYWGMIRVDRVNGIDPETARRRPVFGDLTPVHPDVLINLETDSKNLSQRLINLVNPIGKGQRALIVSPPKAGKTMLLKHIANGISTNYPEILLMVALIGERPEEVTDMRRSVKGEVISSTFDEPTENHTHVAEMALEIAKRQVETGRDVVILLDSITRLARAYNLALPPSGRTLSGGLDPIALYPPKRFFGAARNIEEGGSLTIIGTCLVDTGSRMDDVIYEEFKGTGNSELILDRKLAEKRIFPAIDVQRSGTRREELLLEEPVLKMVWTMRRMLSAVGTNEGIELLLNRLSKTESNVQFLATLNKSLDS